LKELKELKELNISNTDIDEGLEYLLDSLEVKNIICSSDKRLGSGVENIEKWLEDFRNIKE
jgi:hypothetical protein